MPASRSRIVAYADAATAEERVDRIEMVVVWKGEDGINYEQPLDGSGPKVPHDPDREPVRRNHLNGNL